MVAETGVTWRKPTQAGGEHANPKALEMAMTGSRYGLKYLDKHWMEYHSWSPEDESYPTVWRLPSEIGTAVHVAQRMICYQLWWAPDFSSSVTMRFERRLNNVVELTPVSPLTAVYWSTFFCRSRVILVHISFYSVTSLTFLHESTHFDSVDFFVWYFMFQFF